MLVSQTDYDFFSSPSSLSSSSSAVRVTTRPRVPSHCNNPANNPPNSSPLICPVSSPFSLPVSKKRKIVNDDEQLVSSCRSTSNQPPHHRRKRKSAVTRVHSRASSRHNPSSEPIYHSNRSRSTSQFPNVDSGTQSSLFKRRWRTEQHGNLGDRFLGSEDIVRRLLKSYKACVWYLYASWAYFWLITDFKNPSDPNDISFEVHPENYPVAELEYPNTGAKERFVSSQDALLALSSHVSGSFFSHLKTRTTIIRSWILKSPCWQLWSVSLPSSCCFITWESLLFRLLYPRTASPVWTAAAWIVSRHKWISSIFTIAIFFYVFFVLYTSHRHLLRPGRGSSTSNNNPCSSTPRLQTSN